MAAPSYNYDDTSDTLYVSFAPGQPATGIELSDHILLRIDRTAATAVGLTVFEYSLLAQPTELGPRSFPLTGLTDLPDKLRELVLAIMRQSPVNAILTMSAYTPSAIETIPIASVRSFADAAVPA